MNENNSITTGGSELILATLFVFLVGMLLGIIIGENLEKDDEDDDYDEDEGNGGYLF